MKRSSRWFVLALVAATLLAAGGTSLYAQSQTQNQAPPPAFAAVSESAAYTRAKPHAIGFAGIDGERGTGRPGSIEIPENRTCKAI